MPEFLSHVPPGTLMILGALLLPLLGRKSAWGALVLSLVSLAWFWLTPRGNYGEIVLFGESLNMVRIDHLSFIFGLVFHLAAVIASIYALHVEDTKQHIAGMMYAGGAIGACCAGDMAVSYTHLKLPTIYSV